MNKEEAQKTLSNFRLLKKGWDSYHAEEISPDVIKKSKSLLADLPDWGWDAIPCKDGSVQLEVHDCGFDIEILISRSAL